MKTFTYNEKEFLLNGKPYTLVSGAVHYFRIVPEYWEDRLKKLKACGFNTVETYACWNLHERKEGEFDFSGMLDIERFISIAEKLDLNVIVRPGPYICAEWDFGGLPSWLLKYPDISLRCNDPRYLEKVRPYYRELLSRIRPHLCTNGGNIIMVQIENEYGSYGNDKEYLRKVVEQYIENGIDCLLFTSDGTTDIMLNGGTLPEYLSVANFGSRPEERFAALRRFRPNQPIMCGEFWCGWFDHWGEEHHVRTSDETAHNFDRMLEMGASVNFYMFHGGTNFGFYNGANYPGKYLPTITSYDYCAPVSEAGDLTPTFFAVRDIIKNRIGDVPDIEVANTPKMAYGNIRLTERAGMFENLDKLGTTIHSPSTKTMEEMGQDFGYILYSVTLDTPFEKKRLILGDIHDRAHVFKDGTLERIILRDEPSEEILLSQGAGESMRLDILVENMGRVNYGPKLLDKKGLLEGVRIGGVYRFGIDITCMTMDDLSELVYTNDLTFDGKPAFYRGNLVIDSDPSDTFIRLDGFHKGFVKINGFNLGRYWNDRGPQKTLFVPAPILRKGENEIVIFETDGCEVPRVQFVDKPQLG